MDRAKQVCVNTSNGMKIHVLYSELDEALRERKSLQRPNHDLGRHKNLTTKSYTHLLTSVLEL